jgi:hypothetical protein
MKTLHRFRFVLLAVTGVALVAATVYSLRSGDDARTVAGRLGPTPGPSSEGHIRAQKAYLSELASEKPNQRAAALVSLKSYLSAERAEEITRSMDTPVVFLRFPGADPESIFVRTSIEQSLKDRSTDLRREIEAEVDALEAKARSSTGDDRAAAEALAAKRKRELAQLGPGCRCVFAFTVEGASVSELSELSTLPDA